MSSEIKIDGLDKLARGLDALKKVVSSKTILNVIGDRHIHWIDENFREGGKEGAWKPLALNTVLNRRKFSSQPLQDTGKLKNSFIKDVGIGSVEVGTNDPRGRWHDQGTRPRKIIPRTKKALAFNSFGGRLVVKSVDHPGIPARPILPSQGEAEKITRETVEAMLAQVIKEKF